jgi:hypothetical protein
LSEGVTAARRRACRRERRDAVSSSRHRNAAEASLVSAVDLEGAKRKACRLATIRALEAKLKALTEQWQLAPKYCKDSSICGLRGFDVVAVFGMTHLRQLSERLALLGTVEIWANNCPDSHQKGIPNAVNLIADFTCKHVF